MAPIPLSNLIAALILLLLKVLTPNKLDLLLSVEDTMKDFANITYVAVLTSYYLLFHYKT